ncbi:MAG: hypothetical protein QOI71_3042, partial [Gaiellales bacterium]|nr:hypothetical protein [Gaiellales bacterium]
MRSIPALLAALFVLALPGPALAGTFIVPFGYGSSMGLAGWSAKPDAGAICGYEGNSTIFLNAGSLPAHSGCFLVFNAPAAAQIMSVNVNFGWTKASAATALCAYSFAAQPGDTLRRCTGGTFDNAFAASASNWVELGIYNEGATPIALATSRANNVVFVNGGVTLADPTSPDLAASGPGGVQNGLSVGLQWSASDPESGAPSVGYAIDGGAVNVLRGQACSWLCGTAASGSAAVDLSGLADGPHSLTVYAWSYADVTTTVGPLPFHVDRNPPAQPQIRITPDAAAPTPGWWGHAPVALSITTTTADDVASSRVRVYAPSGAAVLDESSAGALATASIPAAALTASGAYEADVVQCDGADHCTASPRAGFHWDGAPPAVLTDGMGRSLGLLAGRDGAHLTWPEAGVETGASGVAGGYAGTGPTAAAARADAFAATGWAIGVPGVSEAAIPAAAIHGAAQVCLAVRPLSGAGVAASSAAVRCAAVDEQPPEVTVSGAARWSGGPQAVALTVADASGAAFTEILLDGVPAAADGASIRIAGEGAHVLRAVARDGAGNETVVERSLGVDASAPAIGSVGADFMAREIRVAVADALSGVALAEMRLAGAALETRISADGSTAIARVPSGLALDGAVVTV